MIKLICFLVFCLIVIFPITVSNAYIKLNYKNYKYEIEKLNKEKTEISIRKIIQCESEGNSNIWGDKNYVYPSFGIVQMQNRTFLWLADLSGKKKLNWKNPNHQIQLLKWALENGQGNLWSCFRILKKKGEI